MMFGFWPDIVPVVMAWTFASVLMVAGSVLIVGIFTAPLGILLIVWAGWLAGRSYVKPWSKADDRRLDRERNSPQ